MQYYNQLDSYATKAWPHKTGCGGILGFLTRKFQPIILISNRAKPEKCEILLSPPSILATGPESLSRLVAGTAQ